MINNFQKLRKYLNFKDGYYYYLQILARKKDNPDQKHVNVIRNFCIDDEEYYWGIEQTVTDMCDFFNARAYLRLNIRSYEKNALQSMKLLADYIMSGQHKSARSLFARVSGKYNDQENKLWIIDLDGDEVKLENPIGMKITELQEVIQKDYQLYEAIQTPNGMHIISNPFNVQQFREEFPDVEIKKDNPTILYAP